jgi:putative ABC transport system permease protein
MVTILRQFAARISAFLRRGRLDRDFEQELHTHLALLTEEYRRRGMPPEDARREARIRLGAPASLADQHRAARSLPQLDSVLLDLRFAFRMVARNRWFSAAAVAALALGIGSNAVGFTIVNAALLRALPFDHSERIYTISWQNRSGHRSAVTADEFREWRVRAQSFDGLAAYSEDSVNISGDRALPEQVRVTWVSANTFGLLRQPPLIGRDFAAEDERAGAAPVAILGHALWKTRYGADPTVLGATLRMNGTAATIIGVMPKHMRFPDDSQIWAPLVSANRGEQSNARDLGLFGRLSDGIARGEAHAELDGLAHQLIAADPAGRSDLLGVRVETFNERFIGGAGRPMLQLVMASVIVVLLIACANVANMLLSRSTFRVHEMAVRTAMGASRWRVVRQLLLESLVLAFIGGVLGLGLAAGGVKVFAAMMQDSGLPFWVVFSIDYVVIGYVAATCMLTAIVFGLAPALHVSKTIDSVRLKEGGKGTFGSVRERWFSGLLIVAEVALTVILLAGSAVMVRSFVTLYSIDIGVDTGRLMTMGVELPESKYPDADARRAFFARLEPRLLSIPGVEAAAVTTGVPSRDGGERLIEVDGPAPAAAPVFVSTVIITPRFFDTVGVGMVLGRNFGVGDGAPGETAIIVNERLAAQFFPGEDPLGKRIRFTRRNAVSGKGGEPWRTIVGISGRILHGSSLDLYENAVVYIPFRQEPPSAAALLVRSVLPPETIMDAVRRQVQALDDDQPVLTIQTLAQMLAEDRWWYRTWSGMFGILATISLILSSVGLYAVLASAVTRRTREIGLRIAVGAGSRQISWLILKRGLAQFAIGLALGLAGAVTVNRILRLGLADIGPNDPLTFAAILVILTAVAVAACLIPVRRATRLDPVIALRGE